MPLLTRRQTLNLAALAVLRRRANAIALDAPIKPYLPFQVVNPTFPDAPITFRMLLAATSS